MTSNGNSNRARRRTADVIRNYQKDSKKGRFTVYDDGAHKSWLIFWSIDRRDSYEVGRLTIGNNVIINYDHQLGEVVVADKLREICEDKNINYQERIIGAGKKARVARIKDVGTRFIQLAARLEAIVR